MWGLVALMGLIGCAPAPEEPTSVRRIEVPAEPPAPVLANGAFFDGLRGWTADGGGERFRVFVDPKNAERPTVTTFVQDGEEGPQGGAAVGSLSQSFVVPHDAVALRFVVHGGRGRILLREGDQIHRQIRGPNSNKKHIPVTWNLMDLRGKQIELVIEDRIPKPLWAFVSVSGFDVIRDTPCVLRNAGFEDGLNGWQIEGEAPDFVWFRDKRAGDRASLSTASVKGGEHIDAAVGRVYQDFVVPEDAIALRFFVHGGDMAAVRLRAGEELLYEATGSADKGGERIAVSWDLVPHRGRPVQLAIEDQVVQGPFAFVGTTGFDLISSRNGP